ncbi:hypothetical protein CY34DRAFT_805223, partial [Suillus luteus UH-Slu-Lm8-n1]
MSSPKSKKILKLLASQIEFERTRRAEATNDTHRSNHKSREIPKPKGQAGRAPPQGYNVQDAMGLKDRNRRYNEFRAIARLAAIKYLNLNKTMRAQDQFVVEYLLVLLQIKHPFLQRFKNVWPMRDMIGQFLRNSRAYHKDLPIILASGRGDDDDSTDSDDSEDGDDSEGGDDTDDEDETEDEDKMSGYGDEYDRMSLGQLVEHVNEPSNHPASSNAKKGIRKSKSSSDTASEVPQHVNKRKQPAVEVPGEESQFALSKKRRIETEDPEDLPLVPNSTRYTLTITLTSQSY